MSDRLTALPLTSVRVTDAFWAEWQRQMAHVGLPHQWRETVATGRIENLRRAARKESGGFVGYRFNDSDVYKLLEATAYATALFPDAALGDDPREATDLIAAAQQPDGYINSYVQLMAPHMKWRSLNAMHEMYCIGHLAEAAVAVHEATGKTRLLDVAKRAAEHVMATFPIGGRRVYGDHQEIELALVRLAHATGESRFTDYARWQTEIRGSRPSPFESELDDAEVVALTPGVRPLYVKDGKYDGAYAQDDRPLVEQSRAVGHAVRAAYYYCGAVDTLADDPQAMAALSAIWDNLTQRRMYVTGGIGSSGRNEGFTDDYDLPNLDAYAETCAGIGLVFWAWRMFAATQRPQYADVLEGALYNAVLSGVSLSCDRYFYDNPLESEGRHARQPWFACACCPPNIARLVLSIGRYALAASEDTVAVALPIAGEYDCGCATLAVRGDYPWSGDYSIQVSQVRSLRTLVVRRPEWATDFRLTVNGSVMEAEGPITRAWADGDEIAVSCPMRPTWLAAHERVLSCAGRVALQRGPLVYCLEAHDLQAPPQHWSVDLEAPVRESLSSDPRLAVRLATKGALDVAQGGALYGASGRVDRAAREAILVPYFSWANRGPNAMQVWLRR